MGWKENALELDHLRSWIGREERSDDVLREVPAAAMAATLDEKARPAIGDELRPLWHWLYFLNLARQSQLAHDGHEKRGNFVPPVPLPRRMFAGAQLSFASPLRLGERARRIARIEDLVLKRGRSGQLAFLRIRVEIAGEHGLAITENQDIVYREGPKPGEASALLSPPHDAVWREAIRPSESLLFRYSALIFNAHRIHYDRPYAVDHEGYGGLVVHGQLVATLLADLARRKIGGRMTAFSFRALRPILDTGTFTLCGVPSDDGARLWAEDATGGLAMEAKAAFG